MVFRHTNLVCSRHFAALHILYCGLVSVIFIVEFPLLKTQFMPRLQKRHFLLQIIFQFQVDTPCFRNVQYKFGLCVLMWCCRNIRKAALFYHRSILRQFVADFQKIFHIIKIHIIVKDKFSGFLIIRNDTHRAVYIFILQNTGVPSAIRVNQSVDTKVTIVNRFVMITAIIIHGLSICRFAMRDGMITPFPDKAATHPVVLLNHLKILFKITRPISHTMAVFYQQKWLASIFFQIFRNLFQCRIHTAV